MPTAFASQLAQERNTPSCFAKVAVIWNYGTPDVHECVA